MKLTTYIVAILVTLLLLIVETAGGAVKNLLVKNNMRRSELTMKSKIWAWAHVVNAHYGGYSITMESKATPVEGAKAYHAGNILMLMAPSEAEADKVAGFERVIWQITSGSDFDFSKSLDAVKALAKKHPNIKGVIIDDLTSVEIGRGMTPENLEKVREQVKSGNSQLELWGVIYTMNFGIPRISDYMSKLDVVTFWTWEAKDLANLETNYSTAERIVNGKPMVLGIYVYDFGGSRPMPMDMMRHQCDTALKWLEEGRTAGVIMLATCNSDYPLPAVEYAKKWTGEIAGRRVKATTFETNPTKVAQVLTAADTWILPQPKAVSVKEGYFDLKKCSGIRLFGCDNARMKIDFPALLEDRCGVRLRAIKGKPQANCISMVMCSNGVPPKDSGLTAADLKKLGEHGYYLRVSKDGITTGATSEIGLYYAARTIAQMATDRTLLPGIVIRDWPSLKYRGVHEDMSRGQVPTLDTFKRLSRILAESKANTLELYIENLFKWKSHPDIAPPEAIAPEEGRELFDYAARLGIEVHPMLQVLGHSNGILSLPAYQRYSVSECKNAPWAMTFDIRKPETIAFVNELVKEICQAFPGKILNVDITEIDIEGLNASGTPTDQATELIYDYVLKLREMIKPYGMRLMIAQGPLDSTGMLAGFGPVISKLPKDIMISSYYTVTPGAYGTAWEKDFPRFKQYGIEFFSQPWIDSHIRIMPDTVHAAALSDAQVSKGVEFGSVGSTTCDWGDDGHYHLTGQTWYPYLYHCACAWTGARMDHSYFDQAFTRLLYGVKSDSVARAINLVGSINSQKIKVFNEKKEVWGSPSYHYWEFWWDPFKHPELVKIADPAGMAADILKPADEASALLDTALKQATRNNDNIEQLIFGTRNYQALGAKLQMLGHYRDTAVPRTQVADELEELVKTYEGLRTDFQRLWLAEDRKNAGYESLVARFDNTITPCKQKAAELAGK
ncbi:MAG TPA: glycoside hydrolase family 20 zincin-like fold domain-containing protein [Armatimonadota bacterium]|nr:glycoside hydrolase family 20 zincin-like fold domain-containing protein [Armatimonadota bacterium]